MNMVTSVIHPLKYNFIPDRVLYELSAIVCLDGFRFMSYRINLMFKSFFLLKCPKMYSEVVLMLW